MDKANKLLELLEKNEEWPLRYMFKFIVPNEENIVEKVKKELPKSERLTVNVSKNGKYAAITCVAFMLSAQQIVDITAKVNSIDGVLSL